MYLDNKYLSHPTFRGILKGAFMHEYVFKMKKGEIEIELKSDDLEFVEEQLNKWRDELLQDTVK